MRKYWTLFTLSWQKQLEVRSDFVFERGRSVAVLLSMYYLWTALLDNRAGIAGYSREQLITYVLVMTLLRAWVLACVTDRIPSEISRGRISELLLRPMPMFGFWATQDVASKALNITAAVVELSVFMALVRPPLLGPASGAAAAVFALSTIGGMIIYFEMSWMLGVLGFWTSQSWGPRFCFEIVLEFCAGAYFPIDLLPQRVQSIMNLLPFPYLVFHPLSIYLGRTPPSEYATLLGIQAMWIVALAAAGALMWRTGLRRYAAEGG